MPKKNSPLLNWLIGQRDATLVALQQTRANNARLEAQVEAGASDCVRLTALATYLEDACAHQAAAEAATLPRPDLSALEVPL